MPARSGGSDRRERQHAGAITNDGVQSYAYDDFGRRTSATSLTSGKTLAYSYDNRGLRTSMDVAAMMTVAYAYDAAMRLTTVQKDSDTAATYAYDAGGRRTSLTLPNGVSTNYAYDANDRVTSITTQDSSSNTLASFAYTLDATGMPTATTKQLQVYDDQAQTWDLQSQEIAYTFDNAYRLTSEVRSVSDGQGGQMESYREEFSYDDIGNRTQRVKDGVTTTNTYNARNQLVSSTTDGVTTTYTYDKNGSMLTSSDGTTTKTMAYDELNRMTSWTDGANSETTTYVGAKWHRSSYTANGGTATTFLYDGDNVVADLVPGTDPDSYDGSKLYVTPFLDQNLSMTVLTGTNAGTYYYSQDRRNSVTTVTTAAGAMSNVYDYTAMGEKLAYTHETAAQRYQYTGREFNSVSGEHYFRYRTYSPSTGMFFTRDPLGYVDGPTLYAGYFAAPLGADPMGLKWDRVCKHADGGLEGYDSKTEMCCNCEVVDQPKFFVTLEKDALNHYIVCLEEFAGVTLSRIAKADCCKVKSNGTKRCYSFGLKSGVNAIIWSRPGEITIVPAGKKVVHRADVSCSEMKSAFVVMEKAYNAPAPNYNWPSYWCYNWSAEMFNAITGSSINESLTLAIGEDFLETMAKENDQWSEMGLPIPGA